MSGYFSANTQIELRTFLQSIKEAIATLHTADAGSSSPRLQLTSLGPIAGLDDLVATFVLSPANISEVDASGLTVDHMHWISDRYDFIKGQPDDWQKAIRHALNPACTAHKAAKEYMSSLTVTDSTGSASAHTAEGADQTALHGSWTIRPTGAAGGHSEEPTMEVKLRFELGDLSEPPREGVPS
jgi:hypothetical protein